MSCTIVVTEGYVLDCAALLKEAAKLLADAGVVDVTTEKRAGPAPEAAPAEAADAAPAAA